MHKYSLLLLVLVLFACKEKQQEVVALEDLIPNSENYNGQQEQKVIEHKPYSSIITLVTFKEIGDLHFDSITGFDDLQFLDRFNPEVYDKFNLWKNGDSTSIWIYKFKKDKSKNAFINWLNCFGKKCQQINLLDDTFIANEKLTIWQNEEAIIYINKSIPSNKEQEKWLNSFRSEFGLNWNYQLVLQKGKAIIWTQDIELKEI